MSKNRNKPLLRQITDSIPIKFQVLIAVVIIGGLYIVATTQKSSKTNEAANSSQNGSVDKPKSTTITQSDAESFCQDEATIKVSGKQISVYTLDTKESFGTDTGEYAKDGTKIYYLQWNGKDRDSGDNVLFMCYISGTPKKMQFQSLTMNSISLDGTSDFQTYDKSGKPDKSL